MNTECILKDAIDHDFYPRDVAAWLLVYHSPFFKPDGKQCIWYSDNAWCLYTVCETHIKINFVFVHPNKRRQGIFTKFINSLPHTNIHITTNKAPVIHALNAMGFKVQGKAVGSYNELHFAKVYP